MRSPQNMRRPEASSAQSAAALVQAFLRWWRGASWKRRMIVLAPLALIVIVILFILASRFFTDYFWFQEVGNTSVFWTRIWARAVVMVGFGLVFFAILYGNLRLARHLVPTVVPVKSGEDEVVDLVEKGGRVRRYPLGIAAAVLAIIFGIGYGGSWTKIWLFLKQSEFGFSAPVFGRDAAFFVFTVPFLRMLLTFVMVAFLFAFAGSLLIYISQRAIRLEGRSLQMAPHVKAHLSVIVAIAMFGKAIDFILGRWGLAYSERGATFGPSYTDVHAQMPILSFLAAVAVVAGILFLANIVIKGWRLPVIALGVLVLTWIIAGQVYPAIVQQYRVVPTEIEKETEYIANNVQATRWAYGLTNVEPASFAANTNLDQADIENNAATIDNIRVWDPATALTAYRQIQEIRTYYSFSDVDVDRYVVDEQYRQMLIAPREFNSSKLSDQARTWVNEHLTYTHGYGIVAGPVSEAAEKGLPKLFVLDIPPRSDTSLQVTRPEIYFGEIPDSFVLVKTTAKEFDYPMGSENVFAEYGGTGGVGIGSVARRLVFSIRFNSLKLLVSDYLTEDSRILYRRSVEERVRTIAPFLSYDRDPYIVLRDDGTLAWIWDAYSSTDLFPNSQPSDTGINYIRNSVKVVVDAYNGDVTFYQMDPSDAITNTWGAVYPGLFTPAESMPDDIRRHLRYPEDLFTVQSSLLAVYHMTDPQVFYNKEDVWEVPTEMFGGEERRVVPYYVMMVLPGEAEEEQVMLQPFTPRSKQNMVSWMAARMDGEQYGELRLITFPKDKLVYGPSQIEARISNDPRISAQITLWDQAGSDVIRGNLLVIPVEDSLIYVEPLYLQAEQGAIPELTRVIVAYGDMVVMENDLQSALATIFSGSGGTTTTQPGGTDSGSSTTTVPGATTTTQSTSTTLAPSTTTTTISGELPTDRGELLDLAERLYEEARAAQRNDDWATYGERIDQLGEVIAALQALEASGQ